MIEKYSIIDVQPHVMVYKLKIDYILKYSALKVHEKQRLVLKDIKFWQLMFRWDTYRYCK